MNQVTHIPENGLFIVDKTRNCKVSYKSVIHLEGDAKDLHEQIKELKRQLGRKECELKEIVEKTFKQNFVFAGMTLNAIEIGWCGVECSWDTTNSTIRIEEISRPKNETPKNEKDVFEKILERHDLKTILNCGVLTREEKRRVLGLPIEVDSITLKGHRK